MCLLYFGATPNRFQKVEKNLFTRVFAYIYNHRSHSVMTVTVMIVMTMRMTQHYQTGVFDSDNYDGDRDDSPQNKS